MNYFELLKHVYKNGQELRIRGSLVKELLNQTLIIQDKNFYFTKNSRNKELVKNYLFKEIPWYFSGHREHNYISKHAKLWKEIINPDETLNSNYGDLVYYKRNLLNYNSNSPASMGLTSFDWAYRNLLKDKNTRAALILYNDRGFNFMHNRDYICTQCQHFMIRNKKLVCTVHLRSSDAIFGLSFNIPWWSIVQQDLYIKLKRFYPGLLLGEITVNIDSAHIYENHFSLVKEMLKDEKGESFLELKKPISDNLGNEPKYYENNINDFVEFKGED